MKLAAFIGCVLCTMLVPTTADCESAFQCFDDLKEDLFAEIDIRHIRNFWGDFGRAFDGICEEREHFVECYSSFTSCLRYLYKHNIALPTSSSFSKGFKTACDQIRTVNSECPEIGLFLIFYGNQIENKAKMLNTKAVGRDTYIDVAMDLICQNKIVFAKDFGKVIRCKPVQRYLNDFVQQSTIDKTVDVMCRNKDVTVKALTCTQRVPKDENPGDLISSIPCIMEYYNSMSDVKTQEESCNKLRKAMACSPLIRKFVLCRKELYGMYMQIHGVQWPCIDVYIDI